MNFDPTAVCLSWKACRDENRTVYRIVSDATLGTRIDGTLRTDSVYGSFNCF